MSTLARNLWRFLTAVLTALLLCAASSNAYAHHHHHAHHQHHTSQASTSVEAKSGLALVETESHKGHQHHGNHSRHHGGDCPMQFVCECNGLGWCGERYKGAVARTAIVDEPHLIIGNACKFPLQIFLQRAGIADLESRKRRDWLNDFRVPVHDWRNILYSDSPRLRI